MAPLNAIEIADLVVGFAGKTVLDHLSLEIRTGEILGLVGASGAGKSVLLRTLLGLGVKSGIDLPNEVQGLVPSTEWKREKMHEKWYAGETISVGIGQGQHAAAKLADQIFDRRGVIVERRDDVEDHGSGQLGAQHIFQMDAVERGVTHGQDQLAALLQANVGGALN